MIKNWKSPVWDQLGVQMEKRWGEWKYPETNHELNLNRDNWTIHFNINFAYPYKLDPCKKRSLIKIRGLNYSVEKWGLWKTIITIVFFISALIDELYICYRIFRLPVAIYWLAQSVAFPVPANSMGAERK